MTLFAILTVAIPSAIVGAFIGAWIAYNPTPRTPRSGISLDSIPGFDAWQVTYDGCVNRGGPCGATDSARYPAPVYCTHGGVKTPVDHFATGGH